MATAVLGLCAVCFPNFLNPNHLYPHFPSSPTNRPSPKSDLVPFITTGASLALVAFPNPRGREYHVARNRGGGHEKSLSRLLFSHKAMAYFPPACSLSSPDFHSDFLLVRHPLASWLQGLCVFVI